MQRSLLKAKNDIFLVLFPDIAYNSTDISNTISILESNKIIKKEKE